MAARKVADVLFRAADRVQFEGWTQRTYARDLMTIPVSATHPDARMWCARGALKTVASSPYWYRLAFEELGYYLGDLGQCPDVMAWNDADERTADDVADTMRRCAKELLESAQP